MHPFASTLTSPVHAQILGNPICVRSASLLFESRSTASLFKDSCGLASQLDVQIPSLAAVLQQRHPYLPYCTPSPFRASVLELSCMARNFFLRSASFPLLCFFFQSDHSLELLGFSLRLFGNEGNCSEDAGTCFWTGVKNLEICTKGLKVFGGCFRVSRCSCTVEVSSTSTESGCLSDSMDICYELDDSAYVSNRLCIEIKGNIDVWCVLELGMIFVQQGISQPPRYFASTPQNFQVFACVLTVFQRPHNICNSYTLLRPQLCEYPLLHTWIWDRQFCTEKAVRNSSSNYILVIWLFIYRFFE